MQEYASLTDLVEAVNQESGYKPHLYPIPAVALEASSVLQPTSSKQTKALVQQAEAAGQRQLWTHTAPTNALLLLNGHPTGAIGDVMSVKLDAASTAAPESVTLTGCRAPTQADQRAARSWQADFG